MRIFLSFRYTGETYESLVQFFRPVCDELERAGHEVFCSLWKEEEYKERKLDVRAMLFDAFGELEKSDMLLAIVRTNDRSEGMLMEVGYALATHKPVYAAVAVGVQTYITQVANKQCSFKDVSDIRESVKKLL